MKTLTRCFAMAAAAALTAAAGCTLGDPQIPTPTGPSTYALSLVVTASPDVLPEDGASQSVIRIVARDENGQPVRNVQLRVDLIDDQGNITTEPAFGVLSTRVLTTNTSGEATTVFTAPLSPFPGLDTGTVVNVRVTPIGTDFAGTNPRGVLIRLVPETVAIIPGAPVPSFTYSPTNPAPGTVITFNGSGSRDPDGAIVAYRWTFSDGYVDPRGHLPVVEHDFTSAGNHFVTLTVTDNEGKTSSLTRIIAVR